MIIHRLRRTITIIFLLYFILIIALFRLAWFTNNLILLNKSLFRLKFGFVLLNKIIIITRRWLRSKLLIFSIWILTRIRTSTNINISLSISCILTISLKKGCLARIIFRLYRISGYCQSIIFFIQSFKTYFFTSLIIYFIHLSIH